MRIFAFIAVICALSANACEESFIMGTLPDGTPIVGLGPHLNIRQLLNKLVLRFWIGPRFLEFPSFSHSGEDFNVIFIDTGIMNA